ncbi:MAG TPA: polysaccharide deacetylase family protein, partial [Acidisarcina sp.]
MIRQVFSDPELKRWKRLRVVIDIAALVSTLVLVAFIFSVIKRQTLPELLLPQQKRNYKPVKPPLKLKAARPSRRKTNRKPSDIPLNSDEGLRAAFYVGYDESSYSSLKQHIQQIDLLFPEWLHVTTPDGILQGAESDYPSHTFNIIDGAGVHGVDVQNKVQRVIDAAKDEAEIFPHLNNYNVPRQKWDGPMIGQMLNNPGSRQRLESQLLQFLSANPNYHGISLDFEEVPDDAEDGYLAFIKELYAAFHPKKLRLYVNTVVSTESDQLKVIADNCDGIILMNYDEHETTSGPGPIASESWFEGNLRRVLKFVPKQKLICAVGNYGYDWQSALPEKGAKRKGQPKLLEANEVSVQDAWQLAGDAEADVHLEGDELNAHFEFDDEDQQVRHDVWFLDGVTALNELRAARQLGIRTFALWRLGSEDSSLWSVWDHPSDVNAPNLLKHVEPGNDVDTEGTGDILHIVAKPQTGSRTINMDTDNFTVTDENMVTYPHAYTVQEYGYDPKKLALTFDDGPDPKWTPKILDILKRENAKAVFMVIGEQAQDNVGLLKRYVAEGHEIGNHTFTHPDISEISPRQVELQLNLTERLFASKLGIQPLYFRPPYSIDQEPDT